MKRSASSSHDRFPAGYRNPSALQARQDAGVAGDDDAIDSTVQEGSHQAVDLAPGQTDSMPFPGAFAYDVLPMVVDQFVQANGVAALTALTTSGLTNASSSATSRAAAATTQLNSALPSKTRNGRTGRQSLTDSRKVNFEGLPPLLFAAKSGNLEQLKSLLWRHGVDVNQVDPLSGNTALICAAAVGNLGAVNLLIANGALVNQSNPKNGLTALIIASEKGAMDVVNALLAQPGIWIDKTEQNGWNAVFSAVNAGHTDIIYRLINAGADVNFVKLPDGLSPLIYGSAYGKLTSVNALLACRNISVEKFDQRGMTALA